jgi:hypothetical protein
MLGLFGFGLLIIALTVSLWYLEIKTAIEAMPLKPDDEKWRKMGLFQQFRFYYDNLRILVTEGRYFILDMMITISAVDVLGMGQGVEGGILGMAFSDAISILLLIIMYKRKKQREQAIEADKDK